MVGANTTPEVLIVEDTLSMALMYQQHLKKSGIKSEICQSGELALTELRKGKVDTVLLDLQLPDMNGLDIIQEMDGTNHNITFIVITANGSINTAVDAMRAGAYDFLIKPFPTEKLLTTVRNALEREKLTTTVQVLKTSLKTNQVPGFLGESPPMLAVYKMIENVANSNAAVFITGESGTGKEVTAQAIHKVSHRRDAPFIALNCAALPENLIESEIFGHVKGAFTGAHEARKGAASQANGGTLFLDEICEMDINLQAKLLRFLQTGQVKRVGSDWSEDVDVRIVCATNRNPMTEVAAKRFREDLFYRLDVLSIELPPLSHRGKDVILLAESFLKTYAAEEGKRFLSISPEAQELMLDYHWPGNIRELQNMVRKAAVVYDGVELEPHMFSLKTVRSNARNDEYKLIGVAGETSAYTPQQSLKTTVTVDILQPMTTIEQTIIEAVITSCNGSIPKASQILQLSPSTIYRKRETWIREDLEQQSKAG
ncbi:sigma-54-dependent Fis family transcriptional regulator [Litorimonas cladophorae]|uniref:Sigma-54-dependent Fis family transcriptional regulator n=1 Tax=Litorimonas cladophorae TaxID=1220491 RepID=A0A918KNE5_9PROT|nr:sigma-54 dependent transcriptional regulator [Litorimonas cladophorae]GGX69786.1 sigma-54-dependent Fis family transcriptional regulator [Litorimonas cladophorae]